MFVNMALSRHQNAPFTRNYLNIHDPCVRVYECVYLKYLCSVKVALLFLCSHLSWWLQIHQMKIDNNQSVQMAETMAANTVVIL